MMRATCGAASSLVSRDVPTWRPVCARRRSTRSSAIGSLLHRLDASMPFVSPPRGRSTARTPERETVAGRGRGELVSGLLRIGELEISGDDQAAVDAYFAHDFRFHGPDGRELDYDGLQTYSGRSARRSMIGPSRVASSSS